jgi:hypothetical protein
MEGSSLAKKDRTQYTKLLNFLTICKPETTLFPTPRLHT